MKEMKTKAGYGSNKEGKKKTAISLEGNSFRCRIITKWANFSAKRRKDLDFLFWYLRNFDIRTHSKQESAD